MPALLAAAPVDPRSYRRLSLEAHAYSVPVVRELPRPLPLGLGSDFIW
jgi:hypothetical protein